MQAPTKKKPSAPGTAGWTAAALGLWLGIAGCSGGGSAEELLLAYSGDCQAWIEPCG